MKKKIISEFKSSDSLTRVYEVAGMGQIEVSCDIRWGRSWSCYVTGQTGVFDGKFQQVHSLDSTKAECLSRASSTIGYWIDAAKRKQAAA